MRPGGANGWRCSYVVGSDGRSGGLALFCNHADKVILNYKCANFIDVVFMNDRVWTGDLLGFMDAQLGISNICHGNSSEVCITIEALNDKYPLRKLI